jgi:hypothetical protein
VGESRGERGERVGITCYIYELGDKRRKRRDSSFTYFCGVFDFFGIVFGEHTSGCINKIIPLFYLYEKKKYIKRKDKGIPF